MIKKMKDQTQGIQGEAPYYYLLWGYQCLIQDCSFQPSFVFKMAKMPFIFTKLICLFFSVNSLQSFPQPLYWLLLFPKMQYNPTETISALLNALHLSNYVHDKGCLGITFLFERIHLRINSFGFRGCILMSCCPGCHTLVLAGIS